MAIDEEGRLDALFGYRLLDTGPEPAFDRITRLAQATLGFPMALISLIDRDRQFFKSRQGIADRETPRCVSFCDQAIQDERTLIVRDARAHPRFCTYPVVLGPPYIRGYWGALLTTAGGHHLGTLCVIDREPRDPLPGQVGILEDLAQLTIDQMELRLLASTDSLTGAKTRRAFQAHADRASARAAARGEPLSLIAFDLDHFKDINDRHGHGLGDRVLRRCVAAAHGQLRRSDALGRLGGEEFAVLLPKLGLDGARDVAERLRRSIAAERIDVAGRPVQISASFGVAEWQPGDRSYTDLAARADAALYAAKSAGRNTVRSMDSVGLAA